MVARDQVRPSSRPQPFNGRGRFRGLPSPAGLLLALLLPVLCTYAQGWSELGEGSASGGGLSQNSTPSAYAAMALDAAGRPTVAWQDRNLRDVAVAAWTGSVWEPLGSGTTMPAGSSDMLSCYPALACAADGTRTIAWVEEASTMVFRIHLKQWTGSAWTELGTGSATGSGVSGSTPSSRSALYPALAVRTDGTPVVAWQDQDTGIDAEAEVHVRQWTGSAWAELGSGSDGSTGISQTAGSRSLYPAVACDAQNHVLVAWADDLSGRFDLYAREWNGTAWAAIGGSAAGGGISQTAAVRSDTTPAVAFDGQGRPVVAWVDGADGARRVCVRRWQNGIWQDLGAWTGSGTAISGIGDDARTVTLAIAGGSAPVVAWQAALAAPTRIYVRRWNGYAWVEAGTGSASGSGISNSAYGASRPALASVTANGSLVAAWDAAVDLPNSEIHVRQLAGTGTDMVLPRVQAAQADHVLEKNTAAVAVTVSYADEVAIDAASLDVGDLVVTGPGGAVLTVASAMIPAGRAGRNGSVTVSYAVSAPGGEWNHARNGAYSIRMAAGEVADSAGNFVEPDVIGSFTVSVPHDPPVLSQQPQPELTVLDGVAVFAVTTTETDPVTYQWQRNGSDIEGATGAEYRLEAVTAEDAGLYRCVVTVEGVSTLSAAVPLVVAGADGAWLCPLAVTGALPATLAFGMCEGAATGDDSFDRVVSGVPPGTPATVALVLEQSGYARDVRSPAAVAEWRLMVAAGDQPVHLDWQAAELPPESAPLRLLETDADERSVAGSLLDMRTTATLDVPAGVTRTYRILLGERPVVPVTLAAGWNALALPSEPLDPAVTTVLRTADGRGQLHHGTVWRWAPGAPGHYESAGEIHALVGYWVYCPQEGRVTGEGLAPAAAVDLKPGWNWAGTPLACDVPADEPRLHGTVWRWDTAADLFQPLLDTEQLLPGQAYWLHAAEAFALPLPQRR